MTNPIDLNYSTYWQRLRHHFALAPLELQVLFVFSFIVTIIDLIVTLFFKSSVYESLKPYVGNGTIMPYLFTCTLIAESMAGKNFIHPSIRSIYTIIVFFLITLIFKIIDYQDWDGENYVNPYFMKNEWQPVWTILIPCFWIVVMLSPRIKKYYQNLNVAYENI